MRHLRGPSSKNTFSPRCMNCVLKVDAKQAALTRALQNNTNKINASKAQLLNEVTQIEKRNEATNAEIRKAIDKLKTEFTFKIHEYDYTVMSQRYTLYTIH